MAGESSPYRVFVVDDHPEVRRMLATWISRQSNLTACGEAESVTEALRRIPEAKPDLVLVDISLKQQNGLKLVKRLAKEQPALHVIVLSGQQKAVFVQEALRLGARGYVTKGDVNTLHDAIQAVLNGGVYVSDGNGR